MVGWCIILLCASSASRRTYHQLLGYSTDHEGNYSIELIKGGIDAIRGKNISRRVQNRDFCYSLR